MNILKTGFAAAAFTALANTTSLAQDEMTVSPTQEGITQEQAFTLPPLHQNMTDKEKRAVAQALYNGTMLSPEQQNIAREMVRELPDEQKDILKGIVAEMEPQDPSPLRRIPVEACIENTTDEIQAMDNRTETSHDYYFYDEGNRETILTALMHGDFSEEQRTISLLAEMISRDAFTMDKNIRSYCLQFADAVGELPYEIHDLLIEIAESFYRYDAISLGIMKEIRKAGQDMIDNGTPLYDQKRDGPVMLYDLVEPE